MPSIKLTAKVLKYSGWGDDSFLLGQKAYRLPTTVFPGDFAVSFRECSIIG